MAVSLPGQLLQDLSDRFECQICLKSVENPHLCPQCSKLFCYECIRGWLQKPHDDAPHHACPNCLASLQLEEFVKFHPGSGLDELKDLVSEKDGKQPVETSEAKAVARLWKLLHETQALFAEAEQKIPEQLENQRASLKQSKDNLIKTINIMVQQEFRGIHQQFNGKLAEVDAWADILTKELNKQQFNLLELEQRITNATGQEVLQQQENFERSCVTLMSKLRSIAPNVKAHSFTSNLIPAASIWRFTVRNYSAARRSNEIQYSDLVRDDIGSIWRLEVHPNGFDDAKNTSLSVFLQLYDGIEGQYCYKVELLNPTQTHCHEDESYFELRKGWGQNHFIDLKTLQDSFLQNDCFELRFSTRALDLVHKYEQLNKRVAQLTSEQESLKKESKPSCYSEVCAVRNVVEAVKSCSCLFTDVLHDDLGGSWRLHVYPGGNGDTKGKFVSVFLELCSGIPNAYEFTVELLNDNSEKKIRKTLQYNFQVGLPYGWKTLLGRDELMMGRYIKKDSLSFQVTIWPPSATQKFRYLRQYHDRLLENAHLQPQPQPAAGPADDTGPSTSQEAGPPLEPRNRKTSLSFFKNFLTKNTSFES